MLQSFAKVRSVDQNYQYHFVRNANSHQLHPCSLLHQNLHFNKIPRWFKWPHKIEKQCPKDIWTLASPTVIHPLGLSHRLPPKEVKSWGASSFQLKQSLLGYLLLLERPQKKKNCVISGYTWDPNHFLGNVTSKLKPAKFQLTASSTLWNILTPISYFQRKDNTSATPSRLPIYRWLISPSYV